MPRSLRLPLVAGAFALAACTDRIAAPELPAPPPGVQAFDCTADVRGLSLQCDAPAPSLGAASGGIIGGQGVNVRLAASNLAYDSAAGVFRMDVTLQNLIPGRTLGTYDGEGIAGIRIFFHAGPTATAGTGEVSLANDDGSESFLAAGEPFFNYALMLAPKQVTEPRQWRFAVPSQVQRFGFTVYVEAPIWDGKPRERVHGIFRQMTAGFSHSCGLTTDHRIFCWGDGARGQLGHGGTSLFLDPVEAAGGREWRLVSAGFDHTCAVTKENEGACWGSLTSEPVTGPGSLAIDSLDAGGRATCATSAGKAYCWGENEWGQLGVGDKSARSAPTPVAGAHTFTDVRVGMNHACALTPEGEAWCWGINSHGQLGAASAETCGQHYPYPCSTTPVRVDTELRFARIDAGSGHTCALTTEGEAYCWGNNVFGQLGDGSTSNAAAPVPVSETQLRFAQIAAMDRNSCGIQQDGVADCWGANPASFSQSVDDVVAGRRWHSIAGAHEHMCGAVTDGQGFCAGREQFGELGDLGTHQNQAPTATALAPLHLVDLPPRAGFDVSSDGYPEAVFYAREDWFHRPFTTYSDDDFGIERRIWSFGDGATGEGNWIRHTYAANGTYTVTLVVVDRVGQRSMKQGTVWVTSYPTP